MSKLVFLTFFSKSLTAEINFLNLGDRNCLSALR